MDVLRIEGGLRLAGRVAIEGAKNAALPIMAASILAQQPVRLTRVPHVVDVDTMAMLLGHLGMASKRQPDDSFVLQTVDSSPIWAPRRWVRRMRAGVCVLGPLVARRGRAVVPLPGGCAIGPRPIDLHLRGLEALGVQVRLQQGCVVARAERPLRGATVSLRGPHGSSVTATAQVLMAAVPARGTTVLQDAAQEPEIVDLCRFLRLLGAEIEGEGSSTIVVRGVEELGGGQHAVIADRIEAGTYLLAGLITQGDVTVERTNPDHLSALLESLARAGAEVVIAGDTVRARIGERPRPTAIEADAYPAFPTDLQPQWTAWMCLARGRTRIRDSVFPERFRHLAALRGFAAQVRAGRDGAIVRGQSALRAAEASIRDLRGGAALVLAALAAPGTSLLRKPPHLDRGYSRMEEKLRQLGARITREPAEQAGRSVPERTASDRGA